MMDEMGDGTWVNNSFLLGGGLQWETPTVPVVPNVSIPAANRDQWNARADHIAVLDLFGNLLWVNDAWRTFGKLSGMSDANYGVGMNYLDVCDRAQQAGSQEASIVARGLREVIAGLYNSVYFRYGFDCTERRHLFAVRITQIEMHGVPRLLVSHERIM